MKGKKSEDALARYNRGATATPLEALKKLAKRCVKALNGYR